jgi:hypothetical protein
MPERIRMLAPKPIVHDPPSQLAVVRELYSRLPETRYLEAWELQHVLFSLGYTNDLAGEAEIDVAIKIARTDWMPEEATA